VRVDIDLTLDPPRSVRAQQVSGMFDVPLTDKLAASWSHNLPIEERPWQVGLVVGASGAGKSVLARELWGDRVVDGFEWTDKPIIDQFPRDMSIRDITALLTSVGFGTVPAWLRPYSTLSNGERFRTDMARAVAESDGSLVVVDEFSSVVDRQVARVASHCVQKMIRRSNRQFVAVTCHYDVIDWLQPDWVYDVTRLEFSWRSVRPRPAMRLTVHEASTSVWKVFARHHYLSSEIAKSAKCFVACVDGELCAFTSYLHFPHAKTRNIKMGHRLVVLPDYQGLGIASRLEDWLGQWLADQGYRYRNVVAHPAMIALYSRSPRWRETHSRSKSVRTTSKSRSLKRQALSSRRLVVRSFEYQPPAKEQVS